MAGEPVVDDFDVAFDQIVSEMEAPPAVPPVDTPPATPPETPPATPPVPPVVPPVDTPPATPPAPPAEPIVAPVVPPIVPAAPAAAAPTPPPPAPPPAPPAPPPAPLPETPEARTAREAFEATIKPYEPTADEKAAMEKFKADFPGEHAAVESQFKAQKQAFNAQVYEAVQSVLKTVAPRLASVEQNTNAATAAQHFTALHTAHADFDAVVPKVAEWIKTLPSYAQVGAQAVFNEGTTQEVIALVTDFKKATNMTPTPPVVPPAAPPAPPRPDGADLTPVSSRRPVTTPKGQADPTDFDGAFAEAVAEMG